MDQPQNAPQRERRSVNETSGQRHPTKQALLDAAIADMEATGEASIRVTKIVNDAGVAYGAIRNHFGSREGLVQEAIAERYLSAVTQGMGVFATRVATVATAEELVEFFREQLQLFGTPSFHQLRVRRAGALGAALPRPALINRIIADQAAYFDSASAAIGLLQDRGVVDPSVNARAFAAWFLGLLLSRIYSDLDPVCDANMDWSEFTLTGILANLLPRGSQPEGSD
jgi:AcrR family transcriptional regulator